MRGADMTVQSIAGSGSILGESPFWWPDEQALYWCDIDGMAILRLDPQGAIRRWPLPSQPGCIAPTDDGRLVVAMRDGLALFDARTSALVRVAGPPYDPALQRFNDGRCDAQGRLHVGTLVDARTPAAGRLYQLDPPARGGGPAQWTVLAGDRVVANGLAFSPDGRRLYWADTRGHRIEVFDRDPVSGALGAPTEWLRFDTREQSGGQRYGGRPDGAAVDVEGAYWVAMYEGSRVLRILPDGRIAREIALPVPAPTMPAFGGPGLRTLFITTARGSPDARGMPSSPLAGTVFRVEVDVPGLPVQPFGVAPFLA
ncbi:MAG: SMP-30/gluconolactonase/LRE family protein [Burkholderiaceae bacterium]